MSNGKHARFSPSNSKRWLTCGKSVLLPAKPKQEQSSYAARGTAIHSYCEEALLGEEPTGTYDGYTVTKDDIETVANPYIEYIREFNFMNDIALEFIEMKVEIHEECYGTSDFVYFNKVTGSLHVVDLKAGQGVYVYITNNTQLQIYALGAMKFIERLGMKVEQVTIHVVQPAVDNIRDLEIPLETLAKLDQQISDTISNINQGVGIYAPSEDACRWCEHKVTCPKLNELANEAAMTQFENTELSERMKIVPALKQFIKGVEEETLKQLNLGEEVPDFKLVRSKGKRVWVDEADAMTFLMSQGCVQRELEKTTIKMLTVAQTEKVLKKKKLKADLTEMIKQSEGTLKVVPVQAPETSVDKTSEAIKDFS